MTGLVTPDSSKIGRTDASGRRGRMPNYFVFKWGSRLSMKLIDLFGVGRVFDPGRSYVSMSVTEKMFEGVPLLKFWQRISGLLIV